MLLPAVAIKMESDPTTILFSVASFVCSPSIKLGIPKTDWYLLRLISPMTLGNAAMASAGGP